VILVGAQLVLDPRSTETTSTISPLVGTPLTVKIEAFMLAEAMPLLQVTEPPVISALVRFFSKRAIEEAVPAAAPPVTAVQPLCVIEKLELLPETTHSTIAPSPATAPDGMVVLRDVTESDRDQAVAPCVPSKAAEQPVVLKVQAPPLVTTAVPTEAFEFVTSVSVYVSVSPGCVPIVA
jgi:hypothetical protein